MWSGARAIVLGVNPWDPTQYYGFAVAPLAMVTLETAGWIWMLASMACAALALRGMLRAFVPARP